MRAFFALDPGDALRHQIARWRARSLPDIGNFVPEQNLHVTLCFLGEINQTQRIELIHAVDELDCNALSLTFDRVEYQARNRIVWLSCTDTPEPLLALVHKLRRISNRSGIRTERRKFKPHLTLIRQCDSYKLDIDHPAFKMQAQSLVLYESKFSAKGVRYYPDTTWNC